MNLNTVNLSLQIKGYLAIGNIGIYWICHQLTRIDMQYKVYRFLFWLEIKTIPSADLQKKETRFLTAPWQSSGGLRFTSQRMLAGLFSRYPRTC